MLWPRRRGRHRRERIANDVQGHRPRRQCAGDGRRRARWTGRAFLRPIAHRGLHSRAKGRIENTAPAFLAAIDKGYGIECDLQAAKDGTPMVFHDDRLDRLRGGAGAHRRLHPPAASRACATGARTRTSSRFAELPGPGRRPRAAAGGGQGRRRHPARGVPRQDRPPGASLQGPDRAHVLQPRRRRRRWQLAPTVPRGLVVGSHQLPPSWWATPERGRQRHHRAPARPRAAGIAFFAIDVRMLRARARLDDPPRPSLPLFSWTIRSPRERAAAARWADAPIFELRALARMPPPRRRRAGAGLTEEGGPSIAPGLPCHPPTACRRPARP